MASNSFAVRASAVVCLSILCVPVAGVIAQTAIKLAKNRYTPQQDDELGRKGAAEVRAQFPIIKDERITTDEDWRSPGGGCATPVEPVGV